MRRPGSLPHAVMTEIQQFFTDEGQRVGDRLPSERDLARKLSVGRSSLREAIQGLETMGLVQRRHGIGTFFVAEPGSWCITPLKIPHRTPVRLLKEVIEGRLLIEVRLAALAAERATAEDITMLRQAATKRAQARPGEYTQRGLDFHLSIAAASRHTVLQEMLKAMASLYWETLSSADESRDEVAAFRARQQGGHDRILDAIISRNPDAAADAMRDHLLELQKDFLSIVEPSRTAN
jgi:GntR family transcriptional regulator, transcriptional repressor for pyruvate dehydrogenase complex